MIRVPVCAYSTMQRDPETGRTISDVEVIVCNDGTAWTLTEDPATKTLAWTQDGVPAIPGTYAALGQPSPAREAPAPVTPTPAAPVPPAPPREDQTREERRREERARLAGR